MLRSFSNALAGFSCRSSTTAGLRQLGKTCELQRLDSKRICATGLQLLVRPANRKRIPPTYIYPTHSSKTRTGFEVPNVGHPPITFRCRSSVFPFAFMQVRSTAMRQAQSTTCLVCYYLSRLRSQSPAPLPGQWLQFVRLRCLPFHSFGTAAIQARVSPKGSFQLSFQLKLRVSA